MKLRYTPIEGYVSTAEAVVNYTGLGARIEPVATNPFDTDSGLPELNPLSTVPTLVTDEGEVLFGGPVIYEYLDSLHDRPKLFPPSGPRLWTVRRQAWQADAIFDLFVRLILESWEPEEARRPAFVERQWNKIVRALDVFESEAGEFGDLDIGQVRLVGALAFIGSRMKELAEMLPGLDPAFDWRSGRSNLSAWYDRTAADPIFNTSIAS